MALRNTSLVPLLFLLMAGTAAAPTPESFYQQARAAQDRGDTLKASTIALEALKRFGDRDDEWTWRLRAMHAISLVNQGKSAEARTMLQRPFPSALRETEAAVNRFEALSYAAYKLGDPAASALITQAYVLAKKKHPGSVGRVLVLRMIVDPPNAPKWAPEAVQYAKKYGDARSELRARGQRALYLARQERFDEAIAMWEAGLVKARARDDQVLIEQFEGNLGWAYFELGDYEMASVLFTSAHDTAIRIGQRADAVPWTYQLGNVRFHQGDPAGAERYYRAAYELAVATKHEQTSIILALLANHELRAGRLAEAQRYVDHAIREAKAKESADDEQRAQVIAARIATAAGRLDEGERLLSEVLARPELSSIKSEAHGWLAQLHAKAGRFVEAEEQFRKSIAEIHDARAEIDDKELRFSYFNAVTELFESYVDFLMDRGRHEAALAVTEMSRAQTLQEALPDSGKPRDARMLAQQTGATILCYWLGSARSYLWIVTPQKISAVPLPPRKTIEAAVDAYRSEFLGSRPSLQQASGRGKALWRMLIEPASASIAPRSRVIIVPDGGLHAFNMETLIVPSPKPHYWIEDAVLSTAGSLGMLVRKPSRPAAAERLLLVGNSPPPAKEFVPLPKAGEEMDKVKRHFDPARSVVLSGAKATPSAYRAKSPGGFTYLHFVAHGLAMRQKPLDSAVVLAREGEVFKLYARDIANQPLTAKLVTISSCHGAGTRSYAGEGLVGLGWAFLHAGADNVVAALWEVNDAATPQLMNAFYAKLTKGTHPATALRDAKLSLLKQEGVLARPKNWAPFLLYGSS